MEQVRAFSEVGPLWTVIAEAAHHLETDPDEAERRILAALNTAPGQQQALQLLVDARRARGDLAGARALLEGMASETPELATVHYELGLLQAEMGEREAAVRSLSRVVRLEPKHPQAWRTLGDLLAETGDTNGAASAYAQQFASSVTDLTTLEQVAALELDQAEIAENVLREYLNVFATDLAALEMLGKLHMRAGRFDTAEEVFRRALEIAPSFQNARANYVSALHQQMKTEEEDRQLDILLENDPVNPEYRNLKAQVLSAAGKAQEAVSYCEDMIRSEPKRPEFWLTYGHILRVAGRQEDCIAAYRKTLVLDPHLSEAWWGLANLRTFRFSQPEIVAMQHELTREDLSDESREFLHFTLGKALEDTAAYEEAFRHYSSGNALVRARFPYDAGEIAQNVEREKQRFTKEFFAAHGNSGNPAADPLFIIGLPRSGSTLIEQILASHSLVEGAGELPTLTAIAQRLEAQQDAGAVAGELLRGDSAAALGAEYLERSKAHRRSSRPYFTDKMPSNFHHLGWICAILPNARIVDARRHPLDCCFSNFKQIFPNRRGPSYDLADIGLYYRGYVELLAHFDRVLPGRIHRVIYEDLVGNPEQEIRRLLEYCGLPFEETCLRFYETERGIRTISSEQVRRPVYKDSVAQWRNFEPWLGPLKASLGSVLDAYPARPERA
jgi:tetratricopeptide (TPR) repeat protein